MFWIFMLNWFKIKYKVITVESLRMNTLVFSIKLGVGIHLHCWYLILFVLITSSLLIFSEAWIKYTSLANNNTHAHMLPVHSTCKNECSNISTYLKYSSVPTPKHSYLAPDSTWMQNNCRVRAMKTQKPVDVFFSCKWVPLTFLITNEGQNDLSIVPHRL